MTLVHLLIVFVPVVAFFVVGVVVTRHGQACLHCGTWGTRSLEGPRTCDKCGMLNPVMPLEYWPWGIPGFGIPSNDSQYEHDQATLFARIRRSVWDSHLVSMIKSERRLACIVSFHKDYDTRLEALRYLKDICTPLELRYTYETCEYADTRAHIAELLSATEGLLSTYEDATKALREALDDKGE